MIHEAIDSLPPRYRQVFRMAYIDKMKSEEIAEALGISVNTVKVIRQRARPACANCSGHLSAAVYPGRGNTFLTLFNWVSGV